MKRPGQRGFRGLLRNTVVSSAAPYGYTLTVWTTGVAVTRIDGRAPTTVDALLMAVGAVLAFTVVGSVALGGPGSVLEPGPAERVRLWGAAHLVPLFANLGICSLLLRAVHGHVAWPLAGFTATAVYLLTMATQFWCASLRRRDRGGVSERLPRPPREAAGSGRGRS